MKLVCPHCGHDGTPETAITALGSHGFNYLADDVVCRDVQVDMEGGRVRLSADIKSSGAGSNPRLECRSCWQTFPAPEGIVWEVAPPAAQAATPPAAAEAEMPAASPTAAPGAPALRVAECLADFVRQCAEDVMRPVSAKLEAMAARLEDSALLKEKIEEVRAGLAERSAGALAVAGEVQALRERLATLEATSSAQAEAMPRFSEQVDRLSARQDEAAAKAAELSSALGQLSNLVTQSQDSLRAWHEAHAARLERLESSLDAIANLGGTLSQIQQWQQNLQARLDTQAEAIRVLHSAAQERLQQREELHAALQRLEQIAGALGEPKPLPDNL